MEKSLSWSRDTLQNASLLVNKRWTPNAIVKCVWTLECWTLYHSLCLQCQNKQNNNDFVSVGPKLLLQYKENSAERD